MLKMSHTRLWEHIIREIIITEVSLLWKTDDWRMNKWRGRKSDCVQWAEREHGACGRGVAFTRNWNVSVTGILRTVSISLYVEGCPYSKNNGNWEIIQLLKAGVGSFMLLFQTSGNKWTKTLTGVWKGRRVEGSKQTEVDPLWDFCDCAKQRIWWFGQNWQMLKWWGGDNIKKNFSS